MAWSVPAICGETPERRALRIGKARRRALRERLTGFPDGTAMYGANGYTYSLRHKGWKHDSVC